MKICLAGEGAQGSTYAQALARLDDVEIVSLAGGLQPDTERFARRWSIPHHSLELQECLRQPGVEAVILGTPSQLHAAHVETALRMGKHLMVEIPMALNLADARRLAELEERTGLTCMVAHTRRYSARAREVKRRVAAGELHLHHLVFETYFFRRRNMNRFGEPRTWVDDLLWHHGCHIVDMVYWLFPEPDMEAWGQVGPRHPELRIPMDLTIGLRTASGCLVSAVLSFNHHGGIQVNTRFIGEEATLRMAPGVLLDHDDHEVLREEPDEAFINQCREFRADVGAGRPSLTCFAECLPVMGILDRIQRCIDAQPSPAGTR